MVLPVLSLVLILLLHDLAHQRLTNIQHSGGVVDEKVSQVPGARYISI